MDPYQHDDLEAAIKAYLKHYDPEESFDKPAVTVIGMGGLVENNQMKRGCNVRHWPKKMSGDEIAQSLGFTKVILVNDLVAAGSGCANLSRDQVEVLYEPEKKDDLDFESGNKICISAGSYLGESFMIKSKFSPQFYDVYSSEGGASTFPIRTDFDHELIGAYNMIEKRHRAVGLFCGGICMPELYTRIEYLKSDLKSSLTEDERGDGGRILQRGVEGKDEIAVLTLNQLIRSLGLESANMARLMRPTGGIFLLGGVINGIRSHLKNNIGTFVANFSEDAHYPIYVVEEKIQKEIGLLGAQ